MSRTERYEEQEIQAALDRERHEPTHAIKAVGSKAVRQVLEVTDVVQQGYEGTVNG